jgi:hypothetical protein
MEEKKKRKRKAKKPVPFIINAHDVINHVPKPIIFLEFETLPNLD